MKEKLVALALAFGLSNCYSIKQDYCVRPVQKLYVNTKPKHYKLNRSKVEGEKDLVELANTADFEEAWIYVEDDNGRGIWYEHGLNETEIKMKIDFGILETIVEEVPDIRKIVFYHIHPVEKSNLVDISQTFSSLDMKTYNFMMDWIKKTLPGLVEKVEFSVAVSTGVYSIKFNNQMFEKLNFKKMNKLHDMIGDERASIQGRLSERFDYNVKNKKNFAKENERFAKQFSNDVVEIKFKPVEVKNVSQ